MDQQAIIAELEGRAFAARISMGAVCKRAGVHPTTFSRWKRSPRNPDPISANMSSIEKLYAALEHVEAAGNRRVRKAVRA
ncbi:hypothetical protein KRZ98_06405 [Sphingobium sp. AS12]|uniref:hypothetical protein n=1 Tax=Sphingobium sp. AS12 TaxID=2849495 RepID=UPI001C31409D|nr:hypothetical protein [Sphingobium sp. AS12]MBV2147922.1 hypothetical protein [Sphingobium sp. AS12]